MEVPVPQGFQLIREVVSLSGERQAEVDGIPSATRRWSDVGPFLIAEQRQFTAQANAPAYSGDPTSMITPSLARRTSIGSERTSAMFDIVGQRRASQGRLRLMLSGSSPTTSLSADQLLERFAAGSARQRRSLIRSVESRARDLAEWGPDVMRPFDPSGHWAAG